MLSMTPQNKFANIFCSAMIAFLLFHCLPTPQYTLLHRYLLF